MSRSGQHPAPDAPLLRRTRWRLALISSAGMLATLLVLGAALYAAVNATLASAGASALRQQASSLQQLVARGGSQAVEYLSGLPDADDPLGRVAFGGSGTGTISMLVQPDGTLFGETPPVPFAASLPVRAGVAAASRAGGADIREVSLDGTPLRVLSEPISVAGQSWVAQVIEDRTNEQRTLATLLAVLGIGGGVALLASLVVGFTYAGRALVPIRESLRRQRQFAADASHELRTPLTVIATSAEHISRHPRARVDEVSAAVEDIQAEGERLARLVDELLLLARADSDAVELSIAPVDLTDVAADTLRGFSRLAEARGVLLQATGSPVMVDVDADRLRQLLGILVDNAIRHSRPEGVVEVSVSGGARLGVVTVADSGPGIRPEDLPRLFDRFFRAAGGPAEGTGLGLSIARWIAERHGGRLTAANRPEGGALFRLELPLPR
jgi:two-component system, OmpR family, sensor histidine kinase CiaH